MSKVINVKFSTGSHPLTQIENDINNILWDSFEKMSKPDYPFDRNNIPFELSISHYYKSGRYTNGCVMDVIETFMQKYQPNMIEQPFELWKPLYDEKANMIVEILERYTNEIDVPNNKHGYSPKMHEYYDIIDDKELVALRSELGELAVNARENSYACQEKIDEIDSKLFEIIERTDNTISHLIKSGEVNNRQAKKCIGSCGKYSNTRSQVIETPLINPHFKGTEDIVSWIIESNSGTLANMLSMKSIVESEVFSKEIQMGALGINVIEDDCGTIDGVKFLIDKSMVGTQYLQDDRWVRFTKENIKPIVGTYRTIRLASKCDNLKDSHICRQCIGPIANNINPDLDVILAIISLMTEILNQIILSTKHFIDSAKNTELDKSILDEALRKKIIPSGNTIRLYDIDTLTIPEDAFFTNFFVKKINFTSETDLFTVSNVTNIRMRKKGEDPYFFNIRDFGNDVALTHNLIEYIIKYRDECLTRKAVFVGSTPIQSLVIDLSKFDRNDPIFIVRSSTTNYGNFAKEVRSILRLDLTKPSSKNDIIYKKQIQPFVDEELSQIDAYHNGVYDLINSKLSLYVGVLGVVIASIESGLTTDPQHIVDSKQRTKKKRVNGRGKDTVIGYNAIMQRSIAVEFAKSRKFGVFKPSNFNASNGAFNKLDNVLLGDYTDKVVEEFDWEYAQPKLLDGKLIN